MKEIVKEFVHQSVLVAAQMAIVFPLENACVTLATH
jgi:hypothetical protein